MKVKNDLTCVFLIKDFTYELMFCPIHHRCAENSAMRDALILSFVKRPLGGAIEQAVAPAIGSAVPVRRTHGGLEHTGTGTI